MGMISTIQLEDKTVTLIGTAHVSHQSAQEVLDALTNGSFDAIAIELDEERFKGLNQEKTWKDTDIIKIIKQKQTGLLMTQLILASYQKRLAKANQINVGQEMITAIQYATENEIRLLKIDRSVTITFQRIWRSFNFYDKMKLLTELILSVFATEKFSEEDLEKLKEQDMLQAALAEVSQKFPKIAETLIFERDRIMAYKLRHASGSNIVAVVGAAHVSGIISHLNNTDLNIDDLMSVPPAGRFNKLLTYIFPLSIIALLIITMALSPDLALNTMATGWFAGLTEATMRKPKVSDFMNLQEDAMHLKGWWKNRVLRILLVVMMANIFASFGSIVTSIDLFKNIFN
ncbi:MAG: TraB family [Erysipelotrichaceae bacterium]|nr:MAG: TraB family [Erysipelotrichaceae bacterium]